MLSLNGLDLKQAFPKLLPQSWKNVLTYNILLIFLYNIIEGCSIKEQFPTFQVCLKTILTCPHLH